MESTAKHDWPMVSLLETADDVTRGHKKVPKSAYEEVGSTPIVDQSMDFICGYTDEVPTLVSPPYIVFGDHTRELKYIDFPFVPGADGVKVLKPAEGIAPKFLYFYLKAHPVQELGYSRHFKLLKELAIPLPPLDEQRRIAAILDEVCALISKLEKQLSLLERQDVKVVEKFLASAEYSFKSLSEVCEVNPKTRFPSEFSEDIQFVPMGAVSESGVLAFTEWRKMDEVRSGYTRFRKFDVLIAKITPCYENGKSAVANIDSEFAAGSTEFHVFRCGAEMDPRFLHAVLNSTVVRTTGMANMRGSSGHKRVPAWVFANLKIPVPPIVVQKKLMDSIDEVIEQKRSSVQEQLQSAAELFRSFSTRAFQGEL